MPNDKLLHIRVSKETHALLKTLHRRELIDSYTAFVNDAIQLKIETDKLKDIYTNR